MRGGRLLAVAGVLVLGLVGCSEGQPASQTLPTTAVTAEATPTLEALGPPDLPMPVEVREQTPAGAEAFIRYYMDVYNLAQSTLDPQYMAALSGGCDTCDRIIDEISQDSAAGYHYNGGAVTTSDVSEPAVSNGTAELAFDISQAELTVVDAAGEPVPDLTFPRKDSPGCGAVLNWSTTTASWVIIQWDIA